MITSSGGESPIAAKRRIVSFSRRNLLSATGGILLPGAASATGDELVRPADEFANSVGVCVHLGGEPYKSRFAQFRELIGAIGIRHLRATVSLSANFASWHELYAELGIRSNLLVSPTTNTVQQMMAYLDAVGPGSVSAIEGPNEVNTNWFIAQPASRGDWSGTVVAYQRDVYRTLRLRYSATTLPVVSPTLLDWKPRDVALIRDAAEFCDIVALHSYVQHAQEPETQENYAALSWYVRNFRDGFKPDAPMMVTETGYTNMTSPGGSGVSELAASVYLPRLLLNNFGAGVLRTFLYEFMDGGVDPANHEHHYGMIHFDGTPKPAYDAVSTLMKALSDRGEAMVSRPRDRPIRLSFPDAPANLRRQAFSRRDGNVVVALWRPMRVWDVGRGIDVAVTPQPISVVPDWNVAQADCMLLNGHAAWTKLAIADGRIMVPVGDRVMLLRLFDHYG
jgi:hypothetical protein